MYETQTFIIKNNSNFIILFSSNRTCIKNTIKYSDDAEVKCPYIDEVYTCHSTVQEREIKAVRKIHSSKYFTLIISSFSYK